MNGFRFLSSAVALVVLAALPSTAAVAPGAVGFIGDTMDPKVYAGPEFSALIPGLTAPVTDMAVDRANGRLYVLTASKLKAYDIDLTKGTPVLASAKTRDEKGRESVAEVNVGGQALALSLDGRTAFVGGTGKVTAINLYKEYIYVFKKMVEGKAVGESVGVEAYKNLTEYPFAPARAVAAIGVHPSGGRLIVVIDALVKKLAITNDLLLSDVGNGTRAELLKDKDLPADFGYITQLDITADVQTSGTNRPKREFAPSIDLKGLIYPSAVAIGVKGLAFSPDGNCLFLSAVGAQTVRATAFGVMPTTDEGTGGIVVLDVRTRPKDQPWVDYLGFVPTTEKGEKTAELRQEIRNLGWKTVHPTVQWARNQLSAAQGQADVSLASNNQFTTMSSLTSFTVASQVLGELEDSFKDYGNMEAYAKMYPHDMVGASSVAINHTGDFGVATMQDTNNLGLLWLTPSENVSGFNSPLDPKSFANSFYIKAGTGKSINGFGDTGTTRFSWAYPQEAVFTSDDSRIYIGMAGGTPKANGTNKFGSADALGLRVERDRGGRDSNLDPGYELNGGIALRSPRQAATLQSFDSSHDKLSDQLKAYNRWNSKKAISSDWKAKLVGTDASNLTIPGKATVSTAGLLDCLNFGYFLPASGVGYRINRDGQNVDTANFTTKDVVSSIEQMGVEWDRLYREYLRTGTANSKYPVTRPYFIVGFLSQPGGDPIKNLSSEVLKYMPRVGLEVDFPYFSENSDMPHDFIESNVVKKPLDNSKPVTRGFDAPNTTALIRLLLDQPALKSIELDPLLLEQCKAIRELAGDEKAKVIPRGTKTSRRDLDDHMFATFSLQVDVDVDSDNDGKIDGSPIEEGIEDSNGGGGKLVWPNTGDLDGDGVPDFASGFDRFPGQDSPGKCGEFSEMRIQIPPELNLAKLKFKLRYSASDPSKVDGSGTPPNQYTLPTGGGAFRVWTLNGTVARRMADIAGGGTYIAPDTEYSVSKLPLDVARKVTLFIEAVRPLGSGESPEVTFELIVDAGPQNSVVQLADTVRVLPANLTIRGLYKSKGSPAFANDYGKEENGYTSEDGLGRIYANQEPSVGPDGKPSLDADGNPKWVSGQTYIDLSCSLGAVELPENLRVCWDYIDPDDPSDVGMDPLSSKIVDPNGNPGDDNLPPIGAARLESWSESAGLSYPITGFSYFDYQIDTNELGYTRKRAYTRVDSNGEAKVRFNMSGVGGNNYRIRVTLVNIGAMGGTARSSLSTGVMTVWKLIHLERDESVGINPKRPVIDTLNDRYKSAFVHWDVRPTTATKNDPPNQDATTKNYYFGADDKSSDTAVTTYLASEFQKRGQAGWYYLASTAYHKKDDWVLAPPAPKFDVLIAKEVNIVSISGPCGSLETTVTWSNLPPANELWVVFVKGPNQRVKFKVSNITKTRAATTLFELIPVSYTFDVDDKSGRNDMDLAMHGFGLGNKDNLTVEIRGPISSRGLTGGKSEVAASGRFRGQTVAFFSGDSIETYAHELGHGLGCAHICGNTAALNVKTRCLMHYGWLWMKNATKGLIPWSDENVVPVGASFCAQHIIFIRQTDLSNDGTAKSRELNWK